MTRPATDVASSIRVRRARTGDVLAIRALIDGYVANGRVLGKATVTLYEDVQEFWVAEDGTGEIVGCGALHVLWADVAEVRTLAVAPELRGHGVGAALLSRLVEQARELGVDRVFCLTFETDFFGRHGFQPISDLAVPPEVYAEMLQSYDEGVAEFLDLDRVKPNTLGNTRMLLHLS